MYFYILLHASDMKKDTSLPQILAVHKIPQKVHDHDMYISPKFSKTIAKMPKMYQQFSKMETTTKSESCKN